MDSALPFYCNICLFILSIIILCFLKAQFFHWVVIALICFVLFYLQSRMDVYMSHAPTGSSIQNILHLKQVVSLSRKTIPLIFFIFERTELACLF